MQPGNVVVRLFPDGPPTPLVTQSQPQPQVMGLEMQCDDSVQLASESLLDPHRVKPDEDKQDGPVQKKRREGVDLTESTPLDANIPMQDITQTQLKTGIAQCQPPASASRKEQLVCGDPTQLQVMTATPNVIYRPGVTLTGGVHYSGTTLTADPRDQVDQGQQVTTAEDDMWGSVSQPGRTRPGRDPRQEHPGSDNAQLTTHDRVNKWLGQSNQDLSQTQGQAPPTTSGENPMLIQAQTITVQAKPVPVTRAADRFGDAFQFTAPPELASQPLMGRNKRPNHATQVMETRHQYGDFSQDVGYIPPPTGNTIPTHKPRVHKATSQAKSMFSCTSGYIRKLLEENRQETLRAVQEAGLVQAASARHYAPPVLSVPQGSARLNAAKRSSPNASHVPSEAGTLLSTASARHLVRLTEETQRQVKEQAEKAELLATRQADKAERQAEEARQLANQQADKADRQAEEVRQLATRQAEKAERQADKADRQAEEVRQLATRQAEKAEQQAVLLRQSQEAMMARMDAMQQQLLARPPSMVGSAASAPPHSAPAAIDSANSNVAPNHRQTDTQSETIPSNKTHNTELGRDCSGQPRLWISPSPGRTQ